MRHRKISGRHQISASGRHLIDGVAFRKSFSQSTDRPAIRIPPRKRIRLTYEEEDEEEDINGGEVLTQHAQLVHENELDSSSDYDELETTDEDADFKLGSDADDVELVKELNDLEKEVEESGGRMDPVEAPIRSDGCNEVSYPLTRALTKRQQRGLGLEGDGIFNLLDDTGKLVTQAYHNPLLDQYYEDASISTIDMPVNQQNHGNSSVKRRSTHTRKSRKTQLLSRRSSTASSKSVRFQGDDIETPATVHGVDETNEYVGGSSQPAEEEEPISPGSNKENVEPGPHTSDSSDVCSHQLEDNDLKTVSLPNFTVLCYGVVRIVKQ